MVPAAGVGGEDDWRGGGAGQRPGTQLCPYHSDYKNILTQQKTCSVSVEQIQLSYNLFNHPV